MILQITLLSRKKKLNNKKYGLAVKEIVVVDKQKIHFRVIEKLGTYDCINHKLIFNIFR